MSLMIDLDLNKNENIETGTSNIAEAMAELTSATESFTITCAQLDILTVATENIESGLKLSNAVAAKGDTNTAIVIGVESLKAGLHIIGQESIVSDIVPATEDITVANESIGSILKSMWEKIKELGKKFWEWVKGLLGKLMNAVTSVVGSGETPADKLLQKLRKLKNDGKDLPSGAEFKEEEQETLAKDIRIPLAMFNKDFGAVGIEEYLKEVSGTSSVAKTSTVTFIKSLIKQVEELLNTPIKDLTFDKVKAIAVKLPDAQTSKNFEVVDGLSKSAAIFLESKKEKVKSKLGIKKDDENFVTVMPTGITGSKITTLVIKVDKDGKEAREALANVTDGSDLASKLEKAVKGIKVSEVTFTAEDLGIEVNDVKSNVKPVGLDDGIKIATEAQKINKDTVKDIDRAKKDMEDEAKEFEKLVKQLGKNIKEFDKNGADEKDVEKLGKAVNAIGDHVMKMQIQYGKAITNGAQSSAENVLKSGVLKIIDKSTEKYTAS